MRRTTVLFVGLALLAGCAPEKEAPKDVSVVPDRGTQPAVPVPDKSHPDAVKIVERCIKVSTDGHPERLEKLKANRATMKGSVVRPGAATGIIPTVRRFEAVWPDRVMIADEFNEGGPVRLTFGLRRPALWCRTVRDGTSNTLDVQKNETAFAADAVGRHWMALLLPLADAATVVFDAKKQTVEGRATDVIKVAVKDCPVFTLWFDEKIGYLGRVDFLHLEYENTAPKAKTFNLMAHRAFGGVLLPTRIDYRQNGPVFEEWTVDAWEFVDKIDDVVFDRPK